MASKRSHDKQTVAYWDITSVITELHVEVGAPLQLICFAVRTCQVGLTSKEFALMSNWMRILTRDWGYSKNHSTVCMSISTLLVHKYKCNYEIVMLSLHFHHVRLVLVKLRVTSCIINAMNGVN